MLYSFDNFLLDTERRELRRGAAPVSVQPQVFDLLEYLIRNRERVVTKDDLIAHIWQGRIVSESVLTTRLNAARTAIGDSGAEQRLIKTLSRKGVRFTGAVREQQAPEAATTMQPTLPLPDKPSIAVLPFQSMSDDSEQEYFADGITDDITTALSKWRWFFVIARNSSFTYKGRGVDVRQVGRELGVRYVLEGAVRKSESKVRINAQLIEAATGNHLWAERYDGDLTDIFAIQDEVIQKVGAAVEPVIAKRESQIAARKAPENLPAWDHYLRGSWHFHQFTEETSSKALEDFQCATALDPYLADAHVGIARVHLNRVVYQYSRDRDKDLHLAGEAARKALLLDNENGYGWYALANILSHTGDSEGGVHHARKAIELNPSFALGHFVVAVSSLYLGRSEEALHAIDTALRLSPNDPQRFAWFGLRASALYLLKRYDEAIATARQSLSIRWYHTACRVLAASCAQLGRMEEASRAVAELAASGSAERTISDVTTPFKSAADRDLYTEGLRKAGMPEK